MVLDWLKREQRGHLYLLHFVGSETVSAKLKDTNHQAVIHETSGGITNVHGFVHQPRDCVCVMHSAPRSERDSIRDRSRWQSVLTAAFTNRALKCSIFTSEDYEHSACAGISGKTFHVRRGHSRSFPRNSAQTLCKADRQIVVLHTVDMPPAQETVEQTTHEMSASVCLKSAVARQHIHVHAVRP